MKTEKFLNSILLLLLPALGVYLFYTCLWTGTLFNTFDPLAEAFIKGKLNIPFEFLDAPVYKGKIYWHEGPMSALVLIPNMLLGRPVGFGLFSFFLSICVFIFLYIIVKTILKSKKTETLWWVFLYFFGSVFIGISFETISWYYAQVLSSLFVILALLFYFKGKKYLLSGIFLSFSIATRTFSILGLMFFLGMIFFSGDKTKEKIRSLIKILLPVVFTIVLLAFYNYSRFENIFETGYNLAIREELKSVSEARKAGFFSIKHLPNNIYWYFIKSPEGISLSEKDYKIKPPFLLPNPWGMSLFFSMPFFFLVFTKKPKTKEEKLLLATVLVFLGLLLCYLTPGFRQYSSRLVNDALPYWFCLLLLQRRGAKLSNKEKIFILISALLNIYLFSVYKWLPFPGTREIYNQKLEMPL